MTYNSWAFTNSEDFIFVNPPVTVLGREDVHLDLLFKFPLSKSVGYYWINSFFYNRDNFGNTDSFSTIDVLDLLNLKGWRSEMFTQQFGFHTIPQCREPFQIIFQLFCSARGLYTGDNLGNPQHFCKNPRLVSGKRNH